MISVIIDTNVFLESLSKTSPYHSIFQSLISGKFSLNISNEILLEYEEVIGSLHKKEILELFMNFLIESPFVHFFSPTFRFNLITYDIDDNKFVDCAIASNASYIVTSDFHFDVLKEIDFPKVVVISPKKFIELLSGSSNE